MIEKSFSSIFINRPTQCGALRDSDSVNVVKISTSFHDPTSDEDRHQIKIAATMVSGEHLHRQRCVILLPPTLICLIIDGAVVV